MIFPLDYVGITQAFSRTKPHWGIDLGWNTITNRPITSVADGVVQNCGTASDGAIFAVVYHEKLHTLTKYWHLSRLTVSKGEIIKQGQQIGNMGSTGNSTAPHLHFETWIGLPANYVHKPADRDLYAVDPLAVTYLTSKQTLSPKNKYNILKLDETNISGLAEENIKLKAEVERLNAVNKQLFNENEALKLHIVELEKQILAYKDKINNLEIANVELKQDIANMEQDIMNRINTLLFKGE